MAVVAVTFSAALVRSGPARGEEDRGNEEQDEQSPDSRVRQGLAIAPVKLNLAGRNVARVGLGSYLVNAVAGCTDCHTDPNYAPGGNPFRGQPEKINTTNYLAGGRQFGPFVSRNLTPEPPYGRPAGLTYEQFEEVMRVGTDFDLAHPTISPLLQIMPWPIFKNMSDGDLRAIYEYLSAIPRAEPRLPVRP
ncbi:MAG: hypothetical protein NVS4B10_05290 [Myxococcales bacterium]